MNLMRLSLFITLAAVLAGPGAFAQSSSSSVPGPTDYAAFSRFVTDRNIFDPNRQPHSSSGRSRSSSHTSSHSRTVSASAPAFSLVGTMSYEKGLFAFFSGNNSDLKKVLPVSGTIVNYTVTAIAHDRVTLELATTNQSQTLELKVGDVMRETSGKWELTGPGEISAGSASAAGTSGTSSPASGNSGSVGTPSSASEPNDVLKRLMEKRQQENQ